MESPTWSRRIALSLIFLSVLAVGLALLQGGGEETVEATPSTTLSPQEQGRAAGALKQFIRANTGDHLLTIRLHGPITSTPTESNLLGSGQSVAMTTRQALDKAADNEAVKGVLLLIDSPGGTVAMSQELNKAVSRVRENKPVVVSFGDVAASGGYYTAVAADRIIANPGTLTASIGVIINTFNMQQLFEEKLGVKALTIKSGRYKDMLSPYKPTDPAEVQLIQTLIDASYQDFLNAVIEGRTRSMKSEADKATRIASIKSVADGRIVLGSQAVKVGLVDALGDSHFAEEVLQKLARERFELDEDKTLPLRTHSGKQGLIDLIGLELHAPAWLQSNSLMGASTPPMPLSMRYPNQPLWIME